MSKAFYNRFVVDHDGPKNDKPSDKELDVKDKAKQFDAMIKRNKEVSND